MSAPFFRTSGLCVYFGGLSALLDLDLIIEQEQIVGLIGPNGAGKTTTFNAITGTIKISSGSIEFQKTDITNWKTPNIAKFGIARTFQNIRLYDDLTVLENVMVARHCSIRYSFIEAISGIGRFTKDERQTRNRASKLLEIMGLETVANEKANSLPYGSQRKLEIARALALDPKLLLLDEPVAGMNQTETAELSSLIKKIRSDLGLTIALIEHDMGFVMKLCDKIKVIDHGIPIAWGSPKEIQNNPKVIAAYLGNPKNE